MNNNPVKHMSCQIGLLSIALLTLASPLLAQTPTKSVPLLFVWKGGNTGLVLGASRGGTYHSWKKTHAQIKGGETYQFYSATGKTGQAKGKKPELAPASGAAYIVELSGLPEAKKTLVGLNGATWNPQPRKPKALSPKAAVYLSAVTDFLKSKGVSRAKPEIAAIWQVDLEGDGVQEVLIEANSPGYDISGDTGPNLKSGDFSLVLLRKVVDGKPRMSTLMGVIHKKPASDAPNRYALSNVLDLNGDGILEIVVEWNYYEGGGANVFQIKNGKISQALEASDGA